MEEKEAMKSGKGGANVWTENANAESRRGREGG